MLLKRNVKKDCYLSEPKFRSLADYDAQLWPIRTDVIGLVGHKQLVKVKTCWILKPIDNRAHKAWTNSTRWLSEPNRKDISFLHLKLTIVFFNKPLDLKIMHRNCEERLLFIWNLMCCKALWANKLAPFRYK
jgi:hypothetical protein